MPLEMTNKIRNGNNISVTNVIAGKARATEQTAHTFWFKDMVSGTVTAHTISADGKLEERDRRRLFIPCILIG